MKRLLLIGAVAVAFNLTGAAAAELPTFELAGFPITAHQVALLGGANVEGQALTSTLTLNGMPASPHQIAVLAPRSHVGATTATVKLTTIGLSER